MGVDVSSLCEEDPRSAFLQAYEMGYRHGIEEGKRRAIAQSTRRPSMNFNAPAAQRVAGTSEALGESPANQTVTTEKES